MTPNVMYCRNISKLIKDKGLSNTEAAKIIGKSRSYVSQIVTEAVSISEKQARRLIKLLGGKESDLYKGIDNSVDIGLSDLEQSIMDNIRNLPENTRFFIAGLIESASLIKHFDKKEQELISFYRNLADENKGTAYQLLQAMSFKADKDRERANEGQINELKKKAA